MSNALSTKAPVDHIQYLVLEFIKEWRVQVFDVKICPKKIAYSASTKSSRMTIGGIEFSIYMKGRPATFSTLMKAMGSMSRNKAQSATSAECSDALFVWLFDESNSLFIDAFGQLNHTNQFDLDDYEKLRKLTEKEGIKPPGRPRKDGKPAGSVPKLKIVEDKNGSN